MDRFTALAWIVAGGLLMSAIALSGAAAAWLTAPALQRAMLPLVSMAAGTLLGGAFFHMIPEGSAALDPLVSGAWLAAGFTTFLGLEQFLHWHHSHQASSDTRAPMTYLILIGDAAHNFLGGLGIGSTFLLDPRAGIVAWLAAAAHEVPQELGDFGVLVHGGWPRRQALAWNFITALTFPAGAMLAWATAQAVEVSGLVLFGAGNFVYIAASDLVPEIKKQGTLPGAALHFACFAGGLAMMAALAFWFRA